LLERARSPRLAARMEAIRALEKLPSLSLSAEKALMEDVVNNPFTTAYISARILGNHNCSEARSLLRELASSSDYMLAGESIIALAKMKDTSFRSEIEKITLDTQNPRLKIMGAEALGLYHNAESVPVLLNILRGENPPPYLRDEVILSIAAILDTHKKFYMILARYSANNSIAATLALDEVDATNEFVNNALNKKKAAKNIFVINTFNGNFHNVVSKYFRENDGREFYKWIMELPEHQRARRTGEIFNHDEHSRSRSIIKSVLSEAVVDKDLSAHDCLRLLIVHWAALELRIWAATLE